MNIIKFFGRGLIYSHRLLVALVSIHLLAFSSLVQSSTVYLQIPSDGANARESFFESQSADDFILTTNSTITDVTWWGSFLDSGISNNIFDVRFFADNGGLPGTQISETLSTTASRQNTGLVDFIGDDIFRFSTPISHVSLLAGVSYYVSIVHPEDATDDVFFWALSNNTGSNYNRNTNPAVDNSWSAVTTFPGNLSFGLVSEPNNHVSEPSTLFLFTMAFLLFGRYRRLL